MQLLKFFLKFHVILYKILLKKKSKPQNMQNKIIKSFCFCITKTNYEVLYESKTSNTYLY
jgi:hypothetical protein